MNHLHTLAADMRRKYLEASRDPSLGLTAPILESWLRTVEPMADERDRLAGELASLVKQFHVESNAAVDAYRQRDNAQAELSAARAALEWYGEQCSALARYNLTKPSPVAAIEAVIVALVLDAGRRATLSAGPSR